ncbi:MAG: zinc-dependent metalloprotease, partial [Bacteroidetes bacterium]|nr:zinc-dependent metalloprotease [Bacteroidota bacterium]
MFKKFPFFLLLLFCNVLNAQSLWEETSESNIPRTGERRIIPQKYKVYQLKLNTLLPILQAAPERFKSNFAESDVVLTLPNAQGNTLQFRLQESPVMEPELQSRYPNIRCYTGRGMDDPSALIKCDLGPWGFHAMVIRPGKSTLFIDPYQHGNRDYYIVYEKSDYLPKKEDALYTCGTATDGLTELSLKNNNSEVQGDCRLRKYRLALACTGEYASFHGGTKPLVLAAMNTTMNRVNGIYEDEIAITMQLVAKNDTLIFLNANSDPYTNNDGATMLGQNVSTCNARIGSANYDIGHVFSTGGGGIAGLGVVCSNSKAQGVTGSSSPVGDAFDVDYVAHEMGHQFGANHTQNNNCNRVTGAAMEPGSASTIMGYAGICSPNVQSNSDDYFHAYSLQEINAYSILGSGNTCAVKITTGNNNPSVSAGADYIIPKSTYFALTASGSDPDNDALSYCWEQMDPEFATMPPVSTSTTGPLFRSFKGTSAPTRYFPRLADIVNNVSPTWEVLPSVSRTMRFRVTVRDNNPAGSCSKEDDVVLSVNSATGPFQVSAPNTNVVWFVGENKTVSWLVNGTNGAPINCANVKISLSTDGGFTYPVILANSVPNTGSANVTVPNNLSNTCRVKVEAIGNIFFDISNVNFSIQQPPTPTFLIAASPSNTQVCANSGNTVTFNLSLSAIAGFNAQVNLSVSGAPAGATVNISPNQVTPNGTATVSISGFLP